MGAERARRRRLGVSVAALGLLVGACSTGGGTTADPVAEGNAATAQGERVLTFTGAGKAKISGTLALPAAPGPAPAVLIVPGPLATTRDGRSDSVPTDALYKDLSKAFVDAGMATFRYDRRGVGASLLEAGQQPTLEDQITDAQEALKYLGARGDIAGSRLAVLGDGMGGPIALKLAATDDRVKSVALVAVPGRPLVDVTASAFEASNGKESADAFRALVAGVLSTGSLPARDRMRSEFQTTIPAGQDALFKAMYSADPVADAAGVKVPVLIALGGKSTSVGQDDAARLSQSLGGRSEVVVAPNANATLQNVKAPPLVQPVVDPNDMSTHGGGAPIADAPRDQPTVARIASFIATSIGARSA